MSDKDIKQNTNESETIGDLQDLIGLGTLFENFIAAETEGLIICDNCLDTAFDDDENLCQAEDKEGNMHIFCCKECMEEWKNRG